MSPLLPFYRYSNFFGDWKEWQYHFIDFLKIDRFILCYRKREPVKFIHLLKITLMSDFMKLLFLTPRAGNKANTLPLSSYEADTQTCIIIISGGHSYIQELLKQKHRSSFSSIVPDLGANDLKL